MTPDHKRKMATVQQITAMREWLAERERFPVDALWIRERASDDDVQTFFADRYTGDIGAFEASQ